MQRPKMEKYVHDKSMRVHRVDAFQVARTPALPANQVNEAKVITAMPTVNLMAKRLVSDRAPLQVAHLNSGQRLAVYLRKDGWFKYSRLSGV